MKPHIWLCLISVTSAQYNGIICFPGQPCDPRASYYGGYPPRINIPQSPYPQQIQVVYSPQYAPPPPHPYPAYLPGAQHQELRPYPHSYQQPPPNYNLPDYSNGYDYQSNYPDYSDYHQGYQDFQSQMNNEYHDSESSISTGYHNFPTRANTEYQNSQPPMNNGFRDSESLINTEHQSSESQINDGHQNIQAPTPINSEPTTIEVNQISSNEGGDSIASNSITPSPESHSKPAEDSKQPQPSGYFRPINSPSQNAQSQPAPLHTNTPMRVAPRQNYICQAGWRMMSRTKGKWCMKVFPGTMNIWEAKEQCKKHESLVSGIENDQERDFIHNQGVHILRSLNHDIHQGSIWVGGKRRNQCTGAGKNSHDCTPMAPNAFEWTDGFTTGKKMFHFRPGQPDYQREGQGFVYMHIIDRPSGIGSAGATPGSLDDIEGNISGSGNNMLQYVRGYVCGKPAHLN